MQKLKLYEDIAAEARIEKNLLFLGFYYNQVMPKSFYVLLKRQKCTSENKSE